MTDFAHVCSLQANDTILVQKYRSTRTGLTIVIAEVEGPVVNGFFCLATEAHDDDGLPHTLEHLVFLGSETFPYKGTLDLLANRCLASGTNAWTDVDHTCYTITTAGSGGFLALLPVYLDHVLYPTLSDSGFTTEVHHVSGEGTDGGVVYCEMQGRENTGESRVHRALCRAMYAGSGYASETGGIMKNLRESTDNKKVREYHAQFYRPANLTIIISGKVNPQDVFTALRPVEERILAKGNINLEEFTRPWQSPVPPLQGPQDIKVLYPTDEEDAGIVYIGVRGPLAKDIRTVTACVILHRYLTDTSVSPLQREFVEIDDPLCSSVSFSVAENYSSMLYVTFENVPKEKIDLVAGKLKIVLDNIASGKEQLDMQRLSTILEKHCLETVTSLENSPHDAIAFMLIGDFLYGNTLEDLDLRLNSVRNIESLLTEPAEFWIDLLNRYLIHNPWVVVRGEPSIKEQLEMADSEKQRVESQVQKLGEKGLLEKSELLRNSLIKNEESPPLHILTSIPVPTTDGISYHTVESWRTDKDPSDMLGTLGVDLSVLPVHARVHNVHTNFVYIFATMDTTALDDALRPYLPLFLELLLESPVIINGNYMPYEEVVAALERDIIVKGTRIGLDSTGRFGCGPFSSSVSLAMQVEPSKYAIGARWVVDLLHHTQFTAERIRVLATKMINDVANARKKGSKVVAELRKALCFKQGTNVQACSMLHQLNFLTGVLARLNSGSQDVVADLEQVRKQLVTSETLALHLAANWQRLQNQWDKESKGNVMDVWRNLVDTNEISNERLTLKVTPDSVLIEHGNGGCVVGLGSIESCFLVHTALCVNNFQHPDLPALMLFLQYLTQLEGPMWKQIRGQGLAYGFSIIPKPNEGVIMLALYRATNPVLAYKEARNIVDNQIRSGVWEEALLQSARSSLVFEIIERVKSIGDIVTQSLLQAYKGVDVDYNRRLVEQVQQIKEADLNRVGMQWLSPLFKPESSLTAIVCPPERVVEISEGFKEFGYNLKVCMTLEESILA